MMSGKEWKWERVGVGESGSEREWEWERVGIVVGRSKVGVEK